MPIVKIPALLSPYANHQSEIIVEGGAAAEVLDHILIHYPALKPLLLSENGSLLPSVNFYIGGKNIRSLQGMDTAVQEDDTVMLIPSIA